MSRIKIILLLLCFITLSFCEESLSITNETDAESNKSEDKVKEPPINEQTEEEEREQYTLFSKKVMADMIGTDSHITKEKFRQFMLKLITRGESLESTELEFYNEMVEKIVSKVPETIEVSELSKYIDQDYLMGALNDLIKEKYGEDALNDFNQNTEEKPDL